MFHQSFVKFSDFGKSKVCLLLADLWHKKSQSKQKSLECLSLIVSTRRSLFNDSEKIQFLDRIINMSSQIMEYMVSDLDSSQEEFHGIFLSDVFLTRWKMTQGGRIEFCRLLARMKHVYQAGEILGSSSFDAFRPRLAAFTAKRLTSEVLFLRLVMVALLSFTEHSGKLILWPTCSISGAKWPLLFRMT